MEVEIGNSPSDLLDDVPDESSALAQVALGARNTGLNNASGSLLYFHKPGPKVSRMSIVCHKRMCFPPKEGSNAEILHEVRRGRFVRVGVCVCAYGGFNVRGPCWVRQSGPNGRGLPLPFLRMGFCRKEVRLVVVEEDGFDWGAKFAQEVRVLVDRKVLRALSYFQTSAL